MVPSWDTWYVRLLRKPIKHTTNMARVEPSPYPYGPCESLRCPNMYKHPRPDCWTLSLLSIAHRWTGLTLEVLTEETLDCTYLDIPDE